MSDVVLVGLISAGGVLASALITQYFAARAASKQIDHKAQQEELQWQRTEAKRKREEHQAQMRDFWALVLQSQNRIVDLLTRGSGQMPPSAESATNAAAHAYAIALMGAPSLRALAKAFYLATANAETTIVEGRLANIDAVKAWRQSFDALEKEMIGLAESSLESQA